MEVKLCNPKLIKYNPQKFKALKYFTALGDFADGKDSPRDYLERCLETIEEREPLVQAFTVVNKIKARELADESSNRWKVGHQLSLIDGIPIGIKDLLETKDMPTQMGCKAYAGNFPKRDNAAVWALRQAGAVIVSKTVTAELGGIHPGPTTNPFDSARTPGGSSSGSAAAIGARMLPVAIGTQVGGSIIRPAGFCGNIALKPSQGAINRGERQATSMSTHGVHAGSPEDMWLVAIEIAKRAGGDRGYPGLIGPNKPPRAVRPNRLLVLETDGWNILDATSKNAFLSLLCDLEHQGVEILRKSDNKSFQEFENSLVGASETCNKITGWENRWAQRNLIDNYPDGVSERAKIALKNAETMTPDDYRSGLRAREKAQRRHRDIAALVDAIISPSCAGPAPLLTNDQPGKQLPPRPTGDAVFNYPSSMLFAPAVTIPLLAINGLPVGVQIIGQQEEDARVSGIARWLYENIKAVVSN